MLNVECSTHSSAAHQHISRIPPVCTLYAADIRRYSSLLPVSHFSPDSTNLRVLFARQRTNRMAKRVCGWRVRDHASMEIYYSIRSVLKSMCAVRVECVWAEWILLIFVLSAMTNSDSSTHTKIKTYWFCPPFFVCVVSFFCHFFLDLYLCARILLS